MASEDDTTKPSRNAIALPRCTAIASAPTTSRTTLSLDHTARLPQRYNKNTSDALSAVLFCLYLRDTLADVSAQVDVQLHAFFDDITVSGEPADARQGAAELLQRLLPAIGLQLNTAKSHFAYFHDEHAPLPRAVLAALAERDITLHRDWLEVVGAVVGRDDDAIRAGVAATLGSDAGTAAFFQRLQLDELGVQSAMVILRQCGVPKMNYALRCTPPPCIAEAAADFDQLVIGAAQSQAAPQRRRGRAARPRCSCCARRCATAASAWRRRSRRRLRPIWARWRLWRRRLCWRSIDKPECTCCRPARRIYMAGSPAAWRSSSTRRPSASSCCRRRRPCSSSTPPPATLPRSSASSASRPPVLFTWPLCSARDEKKQDEGRTLALLTAVSAPRAWDVEDGAAVEPDLELTDTQYRLAARLSLALQPVDGVDLGGMPDSCPLCAHSRVSSPLPSRSDPVALPVMHEAEQGRDQHAP